MQTPAALDSPAFPSPPSLRREALLQLCLLSPGGWGVWGAPPRSCLEREVCSEGSRSGGRVGSAGTSRINTSPPSLSRVPAFLLLSAVYGVPYYQSSPPSPLRKCDQRPLNSSRSCQKGLFRREGGCLLPQPAVPFSRHFRAWQVPIPQGA